MTKTVTIIGGGPAGLFCAYMLVKNGIQVELFEATSGLCKKFLIAGSSGLNLTHSEELNKFSKRYGVNSQYFTSLLEDFSPKDLQDWCADLDVETFTGSSGRIFPTKMSAASMLKNWKAQLDESHLFTLKTQHKFLKFITPNKLQFLKAGKDLVEIDTETTVFATGGSSWKSTGSDGNWANAFIEKGIKLIPFTPMNCGFEREWSQEFKKKIDSSPLKNVVIQAGNSSIRSEMMLTIYGVEGTGIYALSNHIRDAITNSGSTTISLDLRPDLTEEEILKRLNKPRGKNSLTNFLRKSLKVTNTESVLLRELLSKEDFQDIEKLSKAFKKLDIELLRTRPIDEAISTSGGVSFKELDENLMLKQYEGIYICGEMIDWDAPTGGYLLQGCFSTAFRVAQSILNNKK
ncbi:MAG: hypothetical protein BM556_11040 [Bacteriovorax sp. MedPE-SWde]|nr:MAG: hypothetical protein BM556_11040 [Bacteriovorax sp. MedPE-SWde]